MNGSSRKMFSAVGTLGCLLIVGGCGGSGANSAEARQNSRDEERRIMQVEDLTNQRNAFKSEVDRLAQANLEMQKTLTTAKEQLEQARTEAARARAELSAGVSAKQQLAAQNEELAKLRVQLSELRSKLAATPAVAPAPAASPAPAVEQRAVTPPATQPGANINK